ncbi:MAG: hypothetical protein F6K23_25845 [Okeania sp. SIO2C9]|uniref:hypothetical protein n=1 Tax=Okeania sp. SIO2C9 TaxID=2607791 RepID=UPI0013BFF019|nr:hypothetical protein [Okeania sp. SIO2C9]NEQ76158.1 hypothetical protein [Okeania sp. SIO2C9]
MAFAPTEVISCTDCIAKVRKKEEGKGKKQKDLRERKKLKFPVDIYPWGLPKNCGLKPPLLRG